MQKDILENVKSPLLDGLSTATFPTPGVSQEELAKLTQIGGCHLESLSIELDQENINILVVLRMNVRNFLRIRLNQPA